MDTQTQHETLSERNFGIMLMAAFLVIGFYKMISRGSTIYVLLIAAGCLFGVLALAIPRSLRIPTRLWLILSNWLGKFLSPIVLGIIFFGLLTPIATVTRLFGRDEFHLKRTKVNSYWIDRELKSTNADSFKIQF